MPGHVVEGVQRLGGPGAARARALVRPDDHAAVLQRVGRGFRTTNVPKFISILWPDNTKKVREIESISLSKRFILGRSNIVHCWPAQKVRDT